MSNAEARRKKPPSFDILRWRLAPNVWRHHSPSSLLEFSLPCCSLFARRVRCCLLRRLILVSIHPTRRGSTSLSGCCVGGLSLSFHRPVAGPHESTCLPHMVLSLHARWRGEALLCPLIASSIIHIIPTPPRNALQVATHPRSHRSFIADPYSSWEARPSIQ